MPQHTHRTPLLAALTLLPDSRILALDRQASELQLFSPEGELLETFGGEGEGPGELLDPIGLEVADGRAFVWDWRQSRITAFDLASGEVETWSVEGLLNGTHHFGKTTDGFVLGTTTGDFGSDRGEGEFWTTDLGVVTFDPDASTVDTILRVPDRTSGWVNRSQRRFGSPHFTSRANVTASGGEVYWSDGDSAFVVRESPDDPDTLRWNWPHRPVSDEDIEAHRARWLAAVPEQSHPDINRIFEVMPAAETFPVVHELLPDADEGLWMQTYPLPRDSTRSWLRLEGDRLVCRVDLPDSFRAFAGGRDWLMGIATDELDVNRLELREIHPPADVSIPTGREESDVSG